MYVCGSPGVGKTMCVQNVLDAWSSKGSGSVCRHDYLNVIGLHDHLKVFGAIENLIKGRSFVSQIKKRGRGGKDDIGETFAQVADCVDSVIATATQCCQKPTTCVFVVDEIDYLCPSLSAVTRGGAAKSSMAAKRQLELITSLFSLPHKLDNTNCCLIVIGIANSIDLSTKLATLTTNSRSTRARSPLIDSTLIFRPYTAGELKSIVNEVAGDELDAVAVEICSRKVAALHGDCRKVIDLCKQAKAVKTKSGDSQRASVKDLMSVMETAYKSQSESSATLKALPLQQLLVLVAACRHANACPARTDFAISHLRDGLGVLIKELNIPAAAVGQMTSLMEHVVALSNSGLMTVKEASRSKPAVWRLNCPADSLEETLKKTNYLIATALGGSHAEEEEEEEVVVQAKGRRLVTVRE